MKLSPKVRGIAGRIGKDLIHGYLHYTGTGRRIRRGLQKADDIYTKGKTYVDGHQPEVTMAKHLVRKFGGKTGEKIADHIDKAQKTYKKVGDKADKVSRFVKEVSN